LKKMNAQIITHPDALEEVRRLLQENNLPFQDIDLDKGLIVRYRDAEGSLVGCGGLEFYGDHCLLRSVAVDENHRGKSLGKQIVRNLIQRAKGKSTGNIYLLTETAHAFFLTLGFKDIRRDEAPDAIKLASEFTTTCPSSAVCMIYYQ
jgi:amino-acid N-acetyltransferase